MSSREDATRRSRRYSSSSPDQSSARLGSRREKGSGFDGGKSSLRSHRGRFDMDDVEEKKTSKHDRQRDEPRRRDSRDRHRRHDHQPQDKNQARSRRRSRSPPNKRQRRSESPVSEPNRRSRGPLPSQNNIYRDSSGMDGEAPPVEKQKPNFKPTGLLAKEANTVTGTTTVLKYHEPPEARKPPSREKWRMYIFTPKNEMLETIHLHSRSCWLIGRDQKVTDLYIEDRTVSKQHAVIQFRHRTSVNEYGDQISKVKPYLIDLESARGTSLNGKAVEESRYVELVDGDVVRFGDHEREYVVMLPPAEG